MSAAPPSRPPPALRVKLPCDDEKDFYARYADAIAERGLKVPTANLRPVGSRVRLVLEFRDAQTLSGEAIVHAHVEGARPAMNVRILRFDRPRPGAASAPGQPATPAPAPAAAARPPRGAAPPPAAAPETSFESLFEGEQEIAPATAPGQAPQPTADAAQPLEPLFGPSEEPPEPREGKPEPTPPAGPAAPPRGAPLPVASRRAMIVAVAAAGVLVVGVLGYVFARRPAAPPATVPVPAPSAAAASGGALAERIAIADRRLSEGRLTGPDGALDHLLAAKAAAPDDARVKERLALLADTLEKLGARALDRGDLAEAEVHLAAALQAAPERQSIAAKLEALARTPQSGAPRPRGTPPGAETR